MLIRKGPTFVEFARIVGDVSGDKYQGNLKVAEDFQDDLPGTQIRARLAVHNSRGPGARVSWTGRHGPWASWEAYRDVLTELFEQFPNSYVESLLVSMLRIKDRCRHFKADGSWYARHKEYHYRRGYNGRRQFLEMFPQTEEINVGSMIQPTYPRELTWNPELDWNSPVVGTHRRIAARRLRLEIPETPGYPRNEETPAHPQTQAIDEEFGWDDGSIAWANSHHVSFDEGFDPPEHLVEIGETS